MSYLDATGRQILKYIAQTNGAALGFIINDSGGAMVGWEWAGEAYDWHNPSYVQRKKSSKKHRVVTGSNPYVKAAPKLKNKTATHWSDIYS